MNYQAFAIFVFTLFGVNEYFVVECTDKMDIITLYDFLPYSTRLVCLVLLVLILKCVHLMPTKYAHMAKKAPMMYER